MKIKIISFSILLISNMSFGQVGIGTEIPNPSSILELKADNLGFLPPRIKLKSNTDIITIPNPEKGLMIYNLIPDNNETGLNYNGMVVWNGEEWRTLNNLYLGNANVINFDCANVKLFPPTYNVGVPYNGILDLPYSGGNSGLYPTMTIGPNNGLTASTDSGNLLIGNGSLQFKVTGTPTVGSPTTTTFSITLNGTTCDAIVGAGTSIDQGDLVYYQTPGINASVYGTGSGSGDAYNGTAENGWLSYYAQDLPIIEGKLRLDGYFSNAANATSDRVSFNPRVVNISDEPVKFWFAAMTTVDRFNGANIVVNPGGYFNLDNGIYLNRGYNSIISTPTTPNYGTNNQNEIVTLDLTIDDKWYRVYYFPYVNNFNNASLTTEPFAETKIFISIQRLY